MSILTNQIPIQSNSVPISTSALNTSVVAASASWILASKARAYAVICSTGQLATNSRSTSRSPTRARAPART
jgi:hypothetical protein